MQPKAISRALLKRKASASQWPASNTRYQCCKHTGNLCSSSLFTEKGEKPTIGTKILTLMGLRQSSYCPRGRTRRGAIYNSTVMTRSWAVAASYFLQQEQVHPALPSTDKTKVSQPQHRLCAEPDNSLLLDKPCACTTFNNLPGLCPLAASNTAPRVITMKGPDPTSCPQGERGVGGKTHPHLRGTELNKEKKKAGNEDLIKTRHYCLLKCF